MSRWTFPDNHRAWGESLFYHFYTSLFVFIFTEFILILLISLSVTFTKRLAAVLQISVLLYSPTGEY
jgi:hypothetical protein